MSGRDALFCFYCNEPVLPDEALGAFDRVHRECELRAILGGVNHIRRLCTCYGGSAEPDPPGLTKRQAAREALRAWEQQTGFNP